MGKQDHKVKVKGHTTENEQFLKLLKALKAEQQLGSAPRNKGYLKNVSSLAVNAPVSISLLVGSQQTLTLAVESGRAVCNAARSTWVLTRMDSAL